MHSRENNTIFGSEKMCKYKLDDAFPIVQYKTQRGCHADADRYLSDPATHDFCVFIEKPFSYQLIAQEHFLPLSFPEKRCAYLANDITIHLHHCPEIRMPRVISSRKPDPAINRYGSFCPETVFEYAAEESHLPLFFCISIWRTESIPEFQAEIIFFFNQGDGKLNGSVPGVYEGYLNTI
jgi:hypothetical protein